MKILFAILVIPLVVCGAFAADQGETITIGVLENKKFAFATMMRGSFELALENINARGGIKGRALRLVYADDSGDKKKGVAAVRKLVKVDRAEMLVGGYSSSNTLVMARAAERLGIPFLVCTAADDRITQRKQDNIFRLNPPASEYTRGLEGLLLEKVNPSSMAIFYENSPFGTGAAMRMMWFCRENDIEITSIVPYHRERAGPEYFDRLIAPLKNRPPDVVYMVSYMKDGVALVRQLREANIESILCGGAGGFTHPDFIRLLGEHARHLLTATLWTHDQDDPLARRYAEIYRNTYNQTPDYHGAEAYAAAMVAADALRRRSSDTAAAIRVALSATDLQTPFGRIRFESYEKYERQNRSMTIVLQAIGETYKCVWPRDVAVAKLILDDN